MWQQNLCLVIMDARVVLYGVIIAFENKLTNVFHSLGALARISRHYKSWDLQAFQMDQVFKKWLNTEMLFNSSVVNAKVSWNSI